MVLYGVRVYVCVCVRWGRGCFQDNLLDAMHVCVHIYVCVCVCMPVCVYHVCMCVGVCVCVCVQQAKRNKSLPTIPEQGESEEVTSDPDYQVRLNASVLGVFSSLLFTSHLCNKQILCVLLFQTACSFVPHIITVQ